MEKDFVKVKEVKELKVGDRIRHASGNYPTLTVISVSEDGSAAVAVDTWEVTNADEWQVQR